MTLIAALIPAQPLDRLDLHALRALGERGFVVALMDAAFDSPAVRARLIQSGAVAAAVICRVHAPELIARLMDADEVVEIT